MIHYFHEGHLGYDYFGSWHKHAGHIELKKWDDSNVPYKEYPSLYKYREKGMWSVISDFIRRWAILEYGGIYLDCDVELIKPIDKFFEHESFVCIEGPPSFPNAAVSGGKKGNKHHKRMLNDYFDVIEGRKSYPVPITVSCSPFVLRDYVQELKGDLMDESDMLIEKNYDGLVTIPKEVFYPYNWNEEFTTDCITDKTCGIHHWKKGWK